MRSCLWANLSAGRRISDKCVLSQQDKAPQGASEDANAHQLSQGKFGHLAEGCSVPCFECREAGLLGTWVQYKHYMYSMCQEPCAWTFWCKAVPCDDHPHAVCQVMSSSCRQRSARSTNEALSR